MNTEHRQAVTPRLPSLWFNHLDWMDRQIDAWVEAECGGRGIAHRRLGRSDNHGYNQSRQGGDMTHKLTERERWLMEQAYLRGASIASSPQEAIDAFASWLKHQISVPTAVGGDITGTVEEMLPHLADIKFEAPVAAVDYADLPKSRSLPVGFGQNVAIERMVLAQQETNTLLREINDRAAALVANAWATS